MDRTIADSTFEPHYTIGDLAKQWRLGRETIRLLVKDEPDVLKLSLGRRKVLTRYSIPESVARRIHTRLFDPASTRARARDSVSDPAPRSKLKQP